MPVSGSGFSGHRVEQQVPLPGVEMTDPYMADRFGGTSLCAIRQAPRQHCEMAVVEDLADAVMTLEAHAAEHLQDLKALYPYLRHTSDCCTMLQGGPVNPIIEEHCTCGLNNLLKGIK